MSNGPLALSREDALSPLSETERAQYVTVVPAGVAGLRYPVAQVARDRERDVWLALGQALVVPAVPADMTFESWNFVASWVGYESQPGWLEDAANGQGGWYVLVEEPLTRLALRPDILASVVLTKSSEVVQALANPSAPAGARMVLLSPRLDGVPSELQPMVQACGQAGGIYNRMTGECVEAPRPVPAQTQDRQRVALALLAAVGALGIWYAVKHPIIDPESLPPEARRDW